GPAPGGAVHRPGGAGLGKLPRGHRLLKGAGPLLGHPGEVSRTLTYTVPPEWDGRTVKDFARQHLGLSSRAFVKQKYLPGGLVKNGQPCRSVDLLRAGDRLCLTLPEEAETYQAVEGP